MIHLTFAYKQEYIIAREITCCDRKGYFIPRLGYHFLIDRIKIRGNTQFFLRKGEGWRERDGGRGMKCHQIFAWVPKAFCCTAKKIARVKPCTVSH
jgi:hypothetical protein